MTEVATFVAPRVETKGSKPRKESWFEPLEFFMVRAPLLSLEKYRTIFPPVSDRLGEEAVEAAIERLAEAADDPVVREAIAVASSSMLNSLPHLANRLQGRKRDQAVRGLFRYLIRMCARTTPFGLFSGVTTGRFAEKASLSLGHHIEHRKRARPDMEWIFKLIRKLESDREVARQLRVRANKSALVKGTRVKLIVRPGYGLGDETGQAADQTSSIQYSDVVRRTLEMADKPVAMTDLLENLQREYPDAGIETVETFLFQLLEQEYLLSELRPPFMDCSPFDYLLQKLAALRGIDSLYADLHQIKLLLADYNACPIGEGEAVYHRLCAMMSAIAEVKTPLQVDVKLGKAVTLPASVADDVAEAAELMCRLSVHKPFELNDYLNKFLEKYGTAQQVPLLELFDPDLGLGMPEAYQTIDSQPPHAGEPKRTGLLFQCVAEAIRAGSVELELTPEQINELTAEGMAMNQAPLSMEMYYTLVAESPEALNRGDYRLVLGASAGSAGAGKTFGRFLDILGEDFLSEFNRIHERLQAMHPGLALAEAVYMPAHARVANIALAKNMLRYEIVSGTSSSKDDDHTLELDDLLVGATPERFYIKSKKLQTEILPMNQHMLNHKISPAVFRFLIDVAQARTGRWSYFHWGALEHAPFLPRLRYGRIVISAAQWRIGPHNPAVAKDADEGAWIAAFQNWRKKWNVSRHVYLTMGDNRLLLDLEHPLHLSELRREMLKLQPGQEMLLTEHGGDPFQTPLYGAEGSFTGEFVFPLIRRAKVDANAVNAPSSSPGQGTSRQALPAARRQTKLPGSDWLYLKLYGCSEREAECVGRPLRALYGHALQNGWSDRFFFVRYADPEPHIRLRFHGNPRRLWQEGLAHVHSWARQLEEEGLLTRLLIDTYDPELERYGGVELIERAEWVFFADSMAVSRWLEAVRWGEMTFDEEIMGVINIIDYLSGFGLNPDEQFAWLDERFDGKTHMEAFRQKKKQLLTLANPANGWAHLQEDASAKSLICPFLNQRNREIQSYAAAVRRRLSSGTLTNTPDDIVASLIHMHLNRYIGIDREKEKKLMVLTRHTLLSMKHMREGD